VDPSIVAEIQKRLDHTIASEGVNIPLAIESGSRAWGFPSPDSDYDCRFVYVRRKQDYMAMFQKRDVIELPLTPIFDVNGWDLQKAIKLMLKGNAVILEWLQSPINYRRDQEFCRSLLELATRIVDRSAIVSHYLHLLEGTLSRHFNTSDKPSVKKLFYVLRPAMALRQMRLQENLSYPEMNMQEMMLKCNLPEVLQNSIDRLLAKKAVTRELGNVSAPLEILDFVMNELRLAQATLRPKKRLSPETKNFAEETFLKLVDRHCSPDEVAEAVR
jgi:uncharacterized protein